MLREWLGCTTTRAETSTLNFPVDDIEHAVDALSSKGIRFETKGQNERLRLTLVTDGIERAVAQARAAAGDKDVTVIGGAQTIRQCLQPGLADGLQIDLVPVLLGGGLRLFELLDSAPIELERMRAIEYPWFTHLRFRVIR